MEEFTYWVDGKFVPASQAVVPINSRGYRLGDGVFDTERTFNGRIFRLEAHLERLERSLRFVRIDPGLTMRELADRIEETTDRNRPLLERYGDFWVTETITRQADHKGFVSIIVEPLPFERYAGFHAKGVPLVIPSVRSSAQIGMDPKLKATSRLNMVLADLEGKQINPHSMSVLLDEHGNLAEVLYGNLFVMRGGRLRTPTSRAILEGVTRMTTMELIAEEGLPLDEADLQPYDLYTADEAFCTTTSYCVLPIASLNGRPIGSSVPGPATQRLTQAWNRLAGLDIPAQFARYAAQAQPVPVRSAT
ncbi:MAG TPA: aminotransferase class IV [bacterium]|nr:aminotransferase class IV [bacterium]